MSNTNNGLMPIEEVHTLLLYLLKQVNYIIEQYDIPVFSHGGTTLGAVRHQGFIPWDDDIDLIMERKYYDKFVKACEESFPDQVVIRTRENDPFFCEEYIKICYFDEVCRFSELSIDIFILDETNPRKKLFRKMQDLIIRNVRPVKLYKATRQVDYLEKYVPNNLAKRFVVALLSKLFSLKCLTLIQTKAMMAEHNSTEWLVDWGSISPYQRATWPKEYYSKAIKLPFENMYVYASDKYENILKSGYGDCFMALPPMDKRKTHAVHRILNTNINLERIKKEMEC